MAVSLAIGLAGAARALRRLWRGGSAQGIIEAVPNGFVSTESVLCSVDAGSRTKTKVQFLVSGAPANGAGAAVLCWVAADGALHHFYELGRGGGTHTEWTVVGDAFVLLRRPFAGEMPRNAREIAAEDLVCSYRPSRGGALALALAPAPAPSRPHPHPRHRHRHRHRTRTLALAPAPQLALTACFTLAGVVGAGWLGVAQQSRTMGSML